MSDEVCLFKSCMFMMAGTSDVNKDLGPKAKAKNLVPEATHPHQA